MLDTQRSSLSSLADNPDAEDRSFVFLLYPEDISSLPRVSVSDGDEVKEGGEEPLRVPFRTLVVGLLAHQILLQTLGTLLVQGSPHIIPRYDIQAFIYVIVDVHSQTKVLDPPFILVPVKGGPKLWFPTVQ